MHQSCCFRELLELFLWAQLAGVATLLLAAVVGTGMQPSIAPRD